MNRDRDSNLALDLFLHWARHDLQRPFAVAEPGGTIASDGEFRLEVCVRPLAADDDDAAFARSRTLLEDLLADGIPARVALWVPAGARLPADDPALGQFVDHVRQAAIRLGPGERSHVPFPIVLKLRKASDTGGVVSATGGLNPHWARFTNRVKGQFDLDSTALHRLPESDEFLEGLLDAIVERANSMQPGEFAEIPTEDCWTIQRLEGEPGFTVVGVPPSAAADIGLTVRRNFKRILIADGPRLREAAADLKALVLAAPYPRIEAEGASTALRGYDPSSYSGIDFIALVCDGVVKPLIEPPDRALPWYGGVAHSP